MKSPAISICRILLPALLPALLLGACGANSVVISGSFPTPNIGKLPISLAVVYDDNLQEFTYTEYSETG
ncbi:MAG: hypothetical protein F4X78_01805, partial [Gammaproteobacteria bacterium]|nr:hypothetical protein [Gammaproteobacteria bacterium]